MRSSTRPENGSGPLNDDGEVVAPRSIARRRPGRSIDNVLERRLVEAAIAAFSFIEILPRTMPQFPFPDDRNRASARNFCCARPHHFRWRAIFICLRERAGSAGFSNSVRCFAIRGGKRANSCGGIESFGRAGPRRGGAEMRAVARSDSASEEGVEIRTGDVALFTALIAALNSLSGVAAAAAQGLQPQGQPHRRYPSG